MNDVYMVTGGKAVQSVSGNITVEPAPGAATSAAQTDGSQKTQIVDAGGEAVTVTGGKLDVNAAIDTTGLATSALQTTGNTSLATLAGAVAGTEVQVDVLTMPTTTVQATDLDIRNLSAANDTVVVTGGAGQTADVKVTLDGESVPVTGTFWQATQPVSLAASVAVTDNAGSLTVDAPVGTPVFVRLSDGSSAIATLPVSLASVPSHPVTNAGTFAVQAAQSGNWTVKETRSSTPSQTSVSVTNSNTSVLASNANRLGATIYNEGSATCYLKLGSTASTSSYTLQIASGGYYEVPFQYTGAIDGITSASTAQLRITELT